MGKITLPAGTERAVHVYTKVLMERMKKDDGQMLWLVRSEKYGYKKALLARRVEIKGACYGEDMFGKPLAGTGGRGVAILFTRSKIIAHFDGDKPTFVDMDDDKKPAEAKKSEPARKLVGSGNPALEKMVAI